MVATYHRTNSINDTIRQFGIQFPNLRIQHRNIIRKNVDKYATHETSQNRKKDGSGRLRSGRSCSTPYIYKIVK